MCYFKQKIVLKPIKKQQKHHIIHASYTVRYTGRYYGDLQWYAPDGINGDKKDTLLIIAVKINNAKLVEWMLSLDGLDTSSKNGKGLDAMAVAKDLGREHLLLGIAAAGSASAAAAAAAKVPAEKGAAAVDPVGGALPPLPSPPPTPGRDDGDTAEIARLCNAVKMLKVGFV